MLSALRGVVHANSHVNNHAKPCPRGCVRSFLPSKALGFVQMLRTRPRIVSVIASARNMPHGPGITGKKPSEACTPANSHALRIRERRQNRAVVKVYKHTVKGKEEAASQTKQVVERPLLRAR